MNERYLFRGKRVDNGEWVEGYLCYMAVYTDRKPFVSAGTIKYIPAIQCKISENYYESEAVDPSTIGRCTGLEDMNGKLIFESDIYHQGDKEIKYVVVWHDTGLIGKQIRSRSYAGLEYWLDGIEIIGNIHDNPELLGHD